MTEKEMYNLINNQNNQQSNGFAVNEKERGISGVFSALMRKVYTWMTLALLITGVTAYGVASSPTLLMTLMTSRGLLFGLIIAELALVFIITGPTETFPDYGHPTLHRLLGFEWCHAFIRIRSIYDDQYCQGIFYYSRHIWSNGFLWLHNQEGFDLFRKNTLHGADWSDYRYHSKHVLEEFGI